MATPMATMPCSMLALDRSRLQRYAGPFQHDELQRGSGAPEQGGDRQGNLAQLVAPQQLEAVVELVQQVDGVLLQRLVVDAGIRDIEVERGGDQVERCR
jgi:hypothetical protein